MKTAPTSADDVEDLVNHIEIDPEEPENEPEVEPEAKPEAEPDAESADDSKAESEDVSETVPASAQAPIIIDESVRKPDLDKLLEEYEKCMVLLGTGCLNCKKVSSFMDEVYDQHPEVQMIKYQEPGMHGLDSGPKKSQTDGPLSLTRALDLAC